MARIWLGGPGWRAGATAPSLQGAERVRSHPPPALCSPCSSPPEPSAVALLVVGLDRALLLAQGARAPRQTGLDPRSLALLVGDVAVLARLVGRGGVGVHHLELGQHEDRRAQVGVVAVLDPD